MRYGSTRVAKCSVTRDNGQVAFKLVVCCSLLQQKRRCRARLHPATRHIREQASKHTVRHNTNTSKTSTADTLTSSDSAVSRHNAINSELDGVSRVTDSQSTSTGSSKATQYGRTMRTEMIITMEFLDHLSPATQPARHTAAQLHRAGECKEWTALRLDAWRAGNVSQRHADVT